MSDLVELHHFYGDHAAPPPDTLLMVWDSPNIDMGLGTIVGGRPNAQQRPRFDAIGSWILQEAQRLSETLGTEVEAEGTVFTNIAPDAADALRPWVDALRNMGYAVFAKPKSSSASDVDGDMLRHIERRHREGILRGVMVASADGRNFEEPLIALADDGITVYVLGFREHADWAVKNPSFRFVDIEDIPGAFREPLPRIQLDQLPDSGAWLQPFRPLRALLASNPH